ncbi:YlbF family regulator [Pseudolactococcus piscium]|uniref:YlbF family regulator n=1 Tax=Pseudolactococcus piscium TaxID=1364 RepID=UPI0015C90157|nr:YlbF family regulator [Lactococcus piscium]
MPSNQTDRALSDYDLTVNSLLSKLAQHPTVIQFQAAESKLKATSALYALEVEMKALAKDAVLYKKIGKVKAYQETMARSKVVEAQLNNEPILIDYRRKMTAANELLQHLLQNLETQINEELHREN